MEQIKKYLPVIIILVAALVVTGLAVYANGDQATVSGQDTWGFPYWLTPLGYLFLAIIFKGGVKNLNQPVYTLVGVIVYALSAVLLFVPLPPDMKWHYVVGTATLAYIFFG
jgi:hypothetical protein